MVDPRVPKKPYFAQQLRGVSMEGVNGTIDIQEVRTVFPLGEFHSENGAIGIGRTKMMK
jgi:hypothetical protein